MSHFVTVRTEIREREHLLAALRDLSLEFREGSNLTVRGDAPGRQTAEIVVETGCGSDIGFRRDHAENEYTLVADWYNIELGTRLRRQEFLGRLQQRYSYALVCAQAAEQNLVIEEETTENGEIVLLLSERG